MMNEAQTALPGQTFSPRALRILKASVIIMSVLLVLGFGLLLVGIYLQASKIGKAPDGAPAAAPSTAPAQAGQPALPIIVEPGTEVHQAYADQGRLILHLKRAGESEFAVIDLATGRETQRVRLAPR